MGNGVSSPYLDASWQNQVDGEWRSAKARELDKLGGAQRVAVKRGQSMKFRLEWLKNKVHEQGDAMEAALSKDPLAGRHEIIKQEQLKAEKDPRYMHPAMAAAAGEKRRHFSVREWQQMKHTELRALEKLEAQKKTSNPGNRPDWNNLHWAQKKGSGEKEAAQARMRDYWLNMELNRKKQVEKVKLIRSAYAAGPKANNEFGMRGADVNYSSWRKNVFKAKRTAHQALSTLLALQTANGKNLRRKRGLQRLDTFGFYIANHLAGEYDKFTVEAERLGEHMAELRDAKQLVDELRRLRPQTAPVESSPSPLPPPSPSPRTGGANSASASGDVTPLHGKHHHNQNHSVTFGGGAPGEAGEGSKSPSLPALGGPAASPPPGHTSDLRPLTTPAAMAPVGRKMGGAAPKPPAQGGPSSPRRAGRAGSEEGEGLPKTSITSKGMVLDDDVELMREAALMQKLESETAAAQRPAKMMQMYINRSNARWAEALHLDAPLVHHVPRFAAEAGSGATAQVFKAETIAALKAGKVAVQVLCDQEFVRVSEHHAPFDLWKADPWAVLNMLLPAKAGQVESKIEGVHMGPRLLLALATAVDAVAGEGAAARLQVLLHVNDEQEEGVVRDLVDRRHLGFPPENVLLFTQRRRHGYVYEGAGEGFQRKVGSNMAQAGSGFSMMQLAWANEAVWVDAQGERQEVAAPALEHLASKGVTWLLTRRLRDLNLYHPETTLDLDSMAYTLFLNESQGANMSVNVETITNLHGAAQQPNGIVFGHRNHDAAPPATAPGGPRPAGDKTGARPGTTPAPRLGGPLPIVDVKWSDLQSPKMTSAIHDTKARAKGKVTVSTRRFMWQIGTLQKLLVTPAVFHTSLYTHEESVYVNFEAADLTAAPASHCVAVCNPAVARKNISSAADVEQLMAVIVAQDASMAFRRLLGSTLPSKEQLQAANQRLAAQAKGGNLSAKEMGVAGREAREAEEVAAKKAKHYQGIRVVVFIHDNEATQAAVQLLMSLVKPGRDLVCLVTVVGGPMQVPQGRQLLAKYEELARQGLAEVVSEVLLKGSSPLVEQLEEYVVESKADLVILGSHGLGAVGAVMGSVALALMKSISRPILVVKALPQGAGAAAGGGNNSSSLSGVPIQGDGGGAGGSGAGGSGAGSGAVGAAKAGGKGHGGGGGHGGRHGGHHGHGQGTEKLKVLLAVDHASRPALRFVAGKLLSAVRGDRLVLAKPMHPGDKGNPNADTTARRLLENFADIAASFHVHASKLQLGGPLEEEGVRVAEAEKAHVVAVQVPSKTVPENVQALLSKTRSAVLLYRPQAGET